MTTAPAFCAPQPFARRRGSCHRGQLNGRWTSQNPKACYRLLMEPIALGFYAIVCGLLGAAGPKLGALPMRLGIGAAVGLIAASVLPVIQGAMAY
jgi:hypothetical protein